MTTWFGVLAFLANTTVLGSGLVLCAEPDGRIAVEIAGDHDPCSTIPVVVCSSEESDCVEHIESEAYFGCEPCPCDDTPLGIELAPLQKRIQLFDSSDENAYVASSSLYIPTLQDSDANIFVAHNFNTHLGYCAQTQSMRKVVLLI